MSRSTLLTLFFSLILAFPAIAQDPDGPGFKPGDWGLEPSPLVNEGLGLHMYYPAGAKITPLQAGGMMTLLIQSPDDTWELRIRQTVFRAVDESESSAEVFGSALARDIEQKGAPIFERGAVTVGNRTGYAIWSRPATDVAGFLIVETGEDRFLVFNILTDQSNADRARRILEPCLKTVRISSTDELIARAEMELRRGEALINALTEQRLRSLIGINQFYRIYQRSATGGGESRGGESGDWMQDRELGYYQVIVEEGMRGQLNANREESDFAAGEHAKGLLVAVNARYLEKEARNGNPAVFADLQVRMWQAWDRSEEAWLTVVTRRQGEGSFTESESGTRTREDLGYSKLRVVKNHRETGQNKTFTWVVEEPYLTQPEVYLLGSLLPQDGSITGSMRFRAYETTNQDTRSLPTRRDKWYADPGGSGHWRLESRPIPDIPAVVSVFDRTGRLVRREKQNGVVTEPIDVKRLGDIWRRKGLPTSNR